MRTGPRRERDSTPSAKPKACNLRGLQGPASPPALKGTVFVQNATSARGKTSAHHGRFARTFVGIPCTSQSNSLRLTNRPNLFLWSQVWVGNYSFLLQFTEQHAAPRGLLTNLLQLFRGHSFRNHNSQSRRFTKYLDSIGLGVRHEVSFTLNERTPSVCALLGEFQSSQRKSLYKASHQQLTSNAAPWLNSEATAVFAAEVVGGAYWSTGIQIGFGEVYAKDFCFLVICRSCLGISKLVALRRPSFPHLAYKPVSTTIRTTGCHSLNCPFKSRNDGPNCPSGSPSPVLAYCPDPRRRRR